LKNKAHSELLKDDMSKIAIIKTREFNDYHDYDSYCSHKIIDSITDWEEVSDEDLVVLRTMSSRLGFIVLERPVNTPAFIAKTISDYKAMVKAEEARLAKEKRAREDAALARKMKKELKDRASKEKMLAKLVDELGPDAVKSLTKTS
jgi:hypothetical protein